VSGSVIGKVDVICRDCDTFDIVSQCSLNIHLTYAFNFNTEYLLSITQGIPTSNPQGRKEDAKSGNFKEEFKSSAQPTVGQGKRSCCHWVDYSPEVEFNATYASPRSVEGKYQSVQYVQLLDPVRRKFDLAWTQRLMLILFPQSRVLPCRIAACIVLSSSSY
jgi:hypothetical protein